MTRRRILAAALLAGLARAQLQAQGQAYVYDPQPPPGSAYLRFVNALGAELALRPDVLPAQLVGTGPTQRVTPYAVVERAAGRSLALETASAGATGRATLRLEPGSYVTLLHRGDEGGIAATPVTDSADFDRAKARLGFYNAAPVCPAAALKAGLEQCHRLRPGGARHRPGLHGEPGRGRARAECGEAAAGLPPETFDAGGSYSILLIRPEGAAPAALLVRDSTARWRP